MIAKIYSAIPQGYNGALIEVEGDSNHGLPAFNIVGMAAKTVSEARERVRAALTNSGFRFPTKKVTINLAPADLPKDSPGLDLPIAICVLALSEQLQLPNLGHILFAGELSLDGSIRPTRGVVNITETAKKYNFQEVIVPSSNLFQASLVPDIKITGVSNLIELFLHLHGQEPPEYLRSQNSSGNCESPSPVKPLSEPTSTPLNTKNKNFHNSSVQNATVSVTSPIVQNTCSDDHLSFSQNNNKKPKIQPSSSNRRLNPNIVKNNTTDIINSPHFVVRNTQTSNITPHVAPSSSVVENTTTDSATILYPLLDHIHGQATAKRAITIAVAGRHNILFTGPPGAGKSLLAAVAARLLPPPSETEILEIVKIHSLLDSNFYNIAERPFRSPHHTASASSIIGGSAQALPGEISLAHRGVLFLDELPEYSRNVLEALRQPLETHEITISRTHYHCTYPADFMLIGTMNPCPCGHYGDSKKTCTCTPQQISLYQKRLSGPILDRIDLIVTVQPVESSDLLSSIDEARETPNNQNVVKNTKSSAHSTRNAPTKPAKSTPRSAHFLSEHAIVKNNIIETVQRQFERYHFPGKFNSSLSSAEITQKLTLSPSSKQLLEAAIDKFHLSARGYFKAIKVARTIADLDHCSAIKPEHIAEALSYREQSHNH